jgi:hypothetical protein
VRADAAEVVFRYRKVGSQRLRTMALPPSEFLRRFLQHVLPSGFMKVRYFGFLSLAVPQQAFPIYLCPTSHPAVAPGLLNSGLRTTLRVVSILKG